MQTLRLVFVALAIVILTLIGWRAMHKVVPARQVNSGESSPPAILPRFDDLPVQRQSIESRLAEAPAYVAFFADLQRDFPADYDRILGGFAARAAISGRLENPDFYLSETLLRLRQTRGILAAQATAEPLGRIFEVQAQILTKLAATAPPLCVDFLFGGVSDEFFDFSEKNRDLLVTMAEAGLNAILDGQTHKIERPAPTVEDFDLLENALVARGLDTIEIGAVLDGKMPDPPLPAARMCAVGRAYLDALQSLPEDTRLKMYSLAVELMARS
jgi:hypothetical protein